MSDHPSPAATPPPAAPGRPTRQQQPAPDAAPARENRARPKAGVSAKQSADDRRREQDEKLDQALKGTFPASDPYSI